MQQITSLLQDAENVWQSVADYHWVSPASMSWARWVTAPGSEEFYLTKHPLNITSQVKFRLYFLD